jgi:uncharacterized NAD-dependent epimerase/dehydratase family protein
MLDIHTKLAIYMEDSLGGPHGKMGLGVLRYSPNPVVAVIDSTQENKLISDFVSCQRTPCPIVDSLEKARALGAQALLLGTAPPGGILPTSWYTALDHAVSLGFSLINGLHTHLLGRYEKILKDKQFIWDIRKEPNTVCIGSGKAGKLRNKRVLFIGSDMSVGKMTAALECHRSAIAANNKSVFIATGQTGISIAGSGIALDAIRLDYACGAVEEAVLAHPLADLVFIEGQGSLLHPASTANLSLLRGSCPTHLIFCHRAGQSTLSSAPHIKIPDLTKVINLYEQLASACGTYLKPKTIGICLNTAHLSQEEARRAILETQERTNLLCDDVVRHGADKFIIALTQA